MKTSKLLLSAAIISSITLAGLAGTAFAWHPKGVITKKVQNITAASALSEADTAAQAVAAKPGDTLKYVIEIRNDGAADTKGYNDMAKTVMTDTLPAGIELAGSPAQRQITENIGLLKPGQKVTKEYAVKVTSKTNGTIQNTACFTGDSTANDNPQQGCNPAIVKVTVPETPVPPVVPPVTPEAPVTPTAPVAEVPAELPHTGPAETMLGSMFAIGVAWYAIHRYVNSKKELTSALLNR
jgi:uncharacterized repeat protein (TIGR01451 family)